ncbi:hypothetical protein B0T20DRAFT_458862 [Sordaria brevicollis]|uniref:C2H2-type domain-containing protein n=1 Tax=Sordaria brevicollis TaxID=83679 RepID=A0AAE0PLH0_SORBR|nr:hypothetical protein B0T20DRAFT_458862 [Sordaria brevicollis]
MSGEEIHQGTGTRVTLSCIGRELLPSRARALVCCVNIQQQAVSSRLVLREPQGTSQVHNHDRELQRQGGRGTQGDAGGLQACLKHPDTSDHAQLTFEAHSGGVENTTAENTPASQRNPFAKPSLARFQPTSAMDRPPKASDSIKQANTSNPFRKSLHGSSSLQSKSAKENSASFSLLLSFNEIRNTKTSSNSDSAKKPSLDSPKKSNTPSSISDSIKYPDQSLSAVSKKAYSQKRPSTSFSSSKKTGQPYKLDRGPSGESDLFKGNPSYYTPPDPKPFDVTNHTSHRAIDGTMPVGIRIRKSTGGRKLDTLSQQLQLKPGVPFASHSSPLNGIQPTGPATNSDTNQLKVVGGSELAQDSSENVQSSQDSELSEVESIDPQSFGSTSQSPIRVIANSDNEGDDDENNTDENSHLILYDSDKNDESSIIISPKKGTSHNTKPGADKPISKSSVKNKSILSTEYTRSSALDDAPYLVCKDQVGNIVKTAGALIPINYEQLDGDFPWICPVRSCRTMHPHIKALGNHFNQIHKASCFNDNLDGTLTFMGLYTKQSARQPPIIVSKKAMSFDESPMREPSYTTASRYKYRIGLSEKSLPEHLPRSEEQNQDIMPNKVITAGESPPLSKPKKTLTMADPARPYNMWPGMCVFRVAHECVVPQTDNITNPMYYTDSNGKLEKLFGGLLPSGWIPYHEYPKRQWICPIRSCQCLLGNRYQFGRHFKTHRGCQLNDNMDGTFTILCSPSQAQLHDKNDTATPAIVVSREPLDNEPLQPPKIRIEDESGVKYTWVSLSSYLESNQREHVEAVTETIAKPVKENSTMAQSGSGELLSKPATDVDSAEELVMATKDRKYSHWWDTDQKLKDTHGALIPEGYEFDHTWRGRLWICPVRSCRLVCKNIWGLGYHFAKLHSSASLNDNEDGTLSVVGTHSHDAPRVVSKRYISILKDPIVKPCRPIRKKKTVEEKERKRQQKVNGINNPTVKKPTITNLSADPDALWKYLCDITKTDLLRPPHPEFERLIALPRIRDLNVVGKDALTPKHLMRPMLAGALVVQVTGVERQLKRCTACRRGNGPFQECVSICPELAPSISKIQSFVTAPSAIWCCMNCVLNQCFQKCSIKGSLLERLDDGSVKEKLPHWMVPLEGPSSATSVVIKTRRRKASTSQEKDGSVADDEADKDEVDNQQDAASVGYRRSGRIRLQAESASATPSEPQPSTQKRPFASTDTAASTSQEAVAEKTQEDSSSSRPSKRLRGTQSLANAPPAIIQESLMVEDWEKEGKAVTVAGEDGSAENLAFSSLYNLSSTANSHSATTTTQIFSSPSFSAHIIKIPEGESYHFLSQGEESDQTRMCTVVAGKLRVKIRTFSDDDDEERDWEQEFNIGLHGVFKVTKGMEAKVENWGYSSAVMQVTSVKE